MIARDATEIEAREEPARKDKHDDPPPSAGAEAQKKKGRPRKGQEPSDQKRPPKPTRVERQAEQTLGQMLADLPAACDVGSKTNSKGFKETWIG